MTPELSEAIEKTKGAGFSDWEVAARNLGNQSLIRFLREMDPGDSPEGGNAHRVIAERLQAIGLPVQAYVTSSVEAFLDNPEACFAPIPNGDYYFASLRPGTHLAHATTRQQIVDFVKDFAKLHPEPENRQTEIYISHNGEPVMSGHIIIKNDDQPNTILTEFTNGNFNTFHRGFHTPEISVQRHMQNFQWQFRGQLEAHNNDWRDQQKFICNGDVKLSRPEMAQRIYNALNHIPHHDGHYLPGYYEVLLEKVDDTTTRAAFIEANSVVFQ